MPRLIPSLALTAAVVISNAVLEPRASAQVQEAHGVYHTQFENDWVRVVRVRYPANSKLPLHGHPPTVTAYVYLSETHTAENLGTTASDFLRVEFKTDQAGATAPFYRDARPWVSRRGRRPMSGSRTRRCASPG